MVHDHATRVGMIKAVGGEEISLDGRIIWAIFTDDYHPVDFGDRIVAGRDLRVDIAAEDVEDARRGSRVERPADGTAYVVDSMPEPYDAGMVRLRLVAQH